LYRQSGRQSIYDRVRLTFMFSSAAPSAHIKMPDIARALWAISLSAFCCLSIVPQAWADNAAPPADARRAAAVQERTTLDSAIDSAAKPARTGTPLLMWKVSKGPNTAYLLGSIHAARPGFYPLPSEIEKTFSKCDVLVLELDQSKSPPGTMEKMMMQKGMYMDGDNLRNHISADTGKVLDAYLEKHVAMAPAFALMRPWFASFMVPISEVQQLGYDPALGIDRHFANEAQAAGKATDQIEDAEFQLKVMSDFPEDVQDKMLKAALSDLDDTEKDLEQTMRAWKSGSVEEMEQIVGKDERDHPELKEVSEKLLYSRNEGMANKIEDYLKTGKKYFVVVGSGHLVGKRSVVQLLKDRDYKVEQVCQSESAN
jgi:uncharacterized protein